MSFLGVTMGGQAAGLGLPSKGEVTIPLEIKASPESLGSADGSEQKASQQTHKLEIKPISVVADSERGAISAVYVAEALRLYCEGQPQCWLAEDKSENSEKTFLYSEIPNLVLLQDVDPGEFREKFRKGDIDPAEIMTHAIVYNDIELTLENNGVIKQADGKWKAIKIPSDFCMADDPEQDYPHCSADISFQKNAISFNSLPWGINPRKVGFVPFTWFDIRDQGRSLISKLFQLDQEYNAENDPQFRENVCRAILKRILTPDEFIKARILLVVESVKDDAQRIKYQQWLNKIELANKQLLWDIAHEIKGFNSYLKEELTKFKQSVATKEVVGDIANFKAALRAFVPSQKSYSLVERFPNCIKNFDQQLGKFAKHYKAARDAAAGAVASPVAEAPALLDEKLRKEIFRIQMAISGLSDNKESKTDFDSLRRELAESMGSSREEKIVEFDMTAPEPIDRRRSRGESGGSMVQVILAAKIEELTQALQALRTKPDLVTVRIKLLERDLDRNAIEDELALLKEKLWLEDIAYPNDGHISAHKLVVLNEALKKVTLTQSSITIGWIHQPKVEGVPIISALILNETAILEQIRLLEALKIINKDLQKLQTALKGSAKAALFSVVLSEGSYILNKEQLDKKINEIKLKRNQVYNDQQKAALKFKSSIVRDLAVTSKATEYKQDVSSSGSASSAGAAGSTTQFFQPAESKGGTTTAPADGASSLLMEEQPSIPASSVGVMQLLRSGSQLSGAPDEVIPQNSQILQQGSGAGVASAVAQSGGPVFSPPPATVVLQPGPQAGPATGGPPRRKSKGCVIG